MLNASCAANVNEVCAIRSSSVLSSNLMTSMNQNESVILDLNKAVSYFFEFTATYQNIRISLKANYSNCKLLLFSYCMNYDCSNYLLSTYMQGFIQDFFWGEGREEYRKEGGPHVCLTTPTFVEPHPFD